jgi:hypothetical protein
MDEFLKIVRTHWDKFLKIAERMRGTLIVVGIGLLALAGGLLFTRIKQSTMLALDGFYFGIASAYYWWRSGQVSYKRGPSVFTFGDFKVNLRDLQSYLEEVSSVNTSAAICGGLGVLLSTLSGVLGAT